MDHAPGPSCCASSDARATSRARDTVTRTERGPTARRSRHDGGTARPTGAHTTGLGGGPPAKRNAAWGEAPGTTVHHPRRSDSLP